MMSKVKVYQIRKQGVPYRFSDYDRALNNGFNFDKDYTLVWDTELNSDSYSDIHDFLEDIFVQLNMTHPDGFTGHSLSVSDIVEVDGVRWYVNGIGFVKV